jgi:O-antigen/teichoic acid export membrane protein
LRSKIKFQFFATLLIRGWVVVLFAVSIVVLVTGAYNRPRIDTDINPNAVLLYVQIVSLCFLIQAIYRSRQRWRSIGYAVLAQVSFVLVYLLFVRILASAIGMSVAAINKTLDSLGWVALFPGVIGAWLPPRRDSVGRK